jgi:hypothetical protein
MVCLSPLESDTSGMPSLSAQGDRKVRFKHCHHRCALYAEAMKLRRIAGVQRQDKVDGSHGDNRGAQPLSPSSTLTHNSAQHTIHQSCIRRTQSKIQSRRQERNSNRQFGRQSGCGTYRLVYILECDLLRYLCYCAYIHVCRLVNSDYTVRTHASPYICPFWFVVCRRQTKTHVLT